MSLAARQLSRLLLGPLKAYAQAAEKRPCLVGIATTVIKTSAADIFAQKVIEQRDQIDWRRNTLFSAFGFAYLGCWQYYLYAKVFPHITPGIQAVFGTRAVGSALTVLDQFIHHPFLYFPAFYLMRGGMAGEAPAASLDKYREDAWENLKALWMVWVPAQLVNFSIVPVHLRIPFVAGVSFAWTVILSCLRGALEPATKTVADAGAAAAHLVAEAMNDAAQLAAPASLAEVKHPEGGAIVPGSSLAIPSVAMQSAAATGVKALHGSAPSMARTGTAAAAAAAKLAASAL